MADLRCDHPEDLVEEMCLTRDGLSQAIVKWCLECGAVRMRADVRDIDDGLGAWLPWKRPRASHHAEHCGSAANREGYF
jgi:hypothetical protein